MISTNKLSSRIIIYYSYYYYGLPKQPQNSNAQPCALCSACRDWNLGEFCPWDLTGIIGDISTDVFSIEEANTVTTKNSSEAGEEQDSTTMDMEPTMTVNFTVPSEISHSKSASDFMSSMAEIEAWD